MSAQPADKLDMDYINSLPQPFLVRFIADKQLWPVNDFEVQTALMRIDVCGLLQVKHFCEVTLVIDGENREHDPEDFWVDSERAANATPSPARSVLSDLGFPELKRGRA